MYRNEQDTNELKHKQVCIVETEKKKHSNLQNFRSTKSQKKRETNVKFNETLNLFNELKFSTFIIRYCIK